MAQEDEDGRPVDLLALAQGPDARPAWSVRSHDLNVNLIVLESGGEIGEHVNAELDVLVVGIAGEGRLEMEGEEHALRAGQAVIVPRGRRRAIRCTGRRLAYLTCHRRRGGLFPT